MRSLRLAPLAALLIALGGCGGDASWNRQAGAMPGDGGFGGATRNNILVQSGRISQVAGLNNRFSSEVDPMVHFAFDSAVLDPRARAVVARQASWIRQFPEVRFRVFGYTDLVGSAAYNHALGLRRARAVVDALVAHGVDRSRLAALVSFGETRPLIVTQGRAAANRRAITEVSGFVGRGQQLLNGKYAEVIFREYVESAAERPSGPVDGLASIAAAADG